MSDEQEVEQSALKFSAMFPGFMKAAEVIGRIGSLKQATEEATALLEKARAEREALLRQIEQDKTAAAADLTASTKKIAANERIADTAIVAGNARADKIVKEATVSAAQIVAQAHIHAENVIKDADDGVASQSAKLRELSAAIGLKGVEVAKLDAEILERGANLDAVRSQMAALRAKIAV